MAAENLLAVHSGFQTQIGEKCLGHRRQQRNQIFGTLAGRCVFTELGSIELHRHVGGERTTAFVRGFHG